MQSVTSTTNHVCAVEVSDAASSLGVRLVPLLQDVGEELEDLARRAEQMSGVQQPDMRGVVTVELPVQDAEHFVAAAKRFDASHCVEYISIESAEPPLAPVLPNSSILQSCHTQLPSDGSIPYFTAAQGYNRPGQFDVDYLHSLGADGTGQMYADCEFSMLFSHREFEAARITEEPGFGVDPNRQQDHGTASVGITLGGDAFGIKGMANKADGYFFSEHPRGRPYNRARAVAAAISKMRAGDIVLLEMQTGRPFGPAELTQSIWDLTKMGSDAGVVIVAAAGNGNRNLDSSTDAAYRARGDSGAIIVGAGNAQHRKLSFSTYGSRVDVQAWGGSVMTSGYGRCTGFPGSSNRNSRYTPSFSGTSSASALTAGALTLFQSWARRELGAPMAPKDLRDLIKRTSHPGGTGNIGNHVNLRAAVSSVGSPTPAPPPTPPTPAPPTPPTSAPTPTPTPTPPTPTPPTGSCVHETDCDVSPWCSD